MLIKSLGTTKSGAGRVHVGLRIPKNCMLSVRTTRKVKDLWVIDVLADRPKLEEYRYAMAGDKEVPQYELSVIDVQSRKQVKINTDKWKDQSLGVLHAGKESGQIFFERRRRTCDELEICKANTETGESKVLIVKRQSPISTIRCMRRLF